MATSSRTEARESLKAEPGERLDIQTRSVQKMSGSSNCLGVNITDTGRVILGVEPTDSVQLVIYDNGIWIQTHD